MNDTFFFLRLVGAPNPPNNLLITNCYNLTTELTWTAGSDNNASITHYLVEQEDASKPNVFEFHTKVDNVNVTKVVLKLTPWAVLRFRMRAVNNVGPSRPSLPTTASCKTREEGTVSQVIVKAHLVNLVICRIQKATQAQHFFFSICVGLGSERNHPPKLPLCLLLAWSYFCKFIYSL